MNPQPGKSFVRRFMETALIAVVYFALARLGQFVAIHPGNVTPVWPASGFALAIVLFQGRQAWPGLWIGVTCATVWPFLDLSRFNDALRTLATGVAVGPGAVMQAAFGAYLLTRLSTDGKPFESTKGLFVFVGTQAVACLSSATLGVLCLCLGQVLMWSDYPYTWVTWYLGDVLGVVLVAPLLLTARYLVTSVNKHLVEAVVVLTLSTIATILTFGDYFDLSLVFLPLPFVLWASVRGGPFPVAATVLTVAAIAIHRTSIGQGPFASQDPNASLLAVQIFAALTAVAGLAVSAALCEYRNSARELRMTLGELSRSEARYRELFENANDLVFTVDLDGRFTSVNRATEETTGLTRDELVGADLSILVPPEHVEQVRSMIRRKITTGERTRYEIEILAKDGHRIPIEIRSRLIAEKDAPVAIQGIARDVSDQKEAERKLNETVTELERSNEELRQFAAVASHDINAPLRRISQFGQWLIEKKQGQLDEEGREWVNYMISSASHMNKLVNSLLDHSRVDAGQRPAEEVDCNIAARNAIENLSTEIQVGDADIRVGDLPHVMANSVELVQLFQNLIDNAIKATGDHRPVVRIDATNQAGECVITVRDNGIGILPEDRDRIFDAFVRIHDSRVAEGTGIGLATCKKIVERWGGRIWVEPAEGRGSKFRFTLPICQPA